MDKVEKVSRELFDKATTYFQGELSSTCDTYALLEVIFKLIYVDLFQTGQMSKKVCFVSGRVFFGQMKVEFQHYTSSM